MKGPHSCVRMKVNITELLVNDNNVTMTKDRSVTRTSVTRTKQNKTNRQSENGRNTKDRHGLTDGLTEHESTSRRNSPQRKWCAISTAWTQRLDMKNTEHKLARATSQNVTARIKYAPFGTARILYAPTGDATCAFQHENSAVCS